MTSFLHHLRTFVRRKKKDCLSFSLLCWSLVRYKKKKTNMPWCVAVGCNSNSFKKNRNKDVKFFSIPKNESLRKKWFANIKRENPPKEPMICHLHFEESCFRRDLQVREIFLSGVWIIRVNRCGGLEIKGFGCILPKFGRSQIVLHGSK